ncbi:MAG: outer membrane protein assembly factor BamB [Gammaproteobacteria bacterium]|nr:outer membrane protein assembly factor BamB [Gammaproteobacteria bacterium]
MQSRSVYLAAALLWLSGCANDTTEEPAELTPFQPEAKIKVIWQKNTGSGSGQDGVVLRPWFSGTAIYIAGDDGKLMALDKESGKTLWKIDTDMKISAGVGGGSSMVFVGSGDGQLAAYWQRNGEKVWQTNLSSEILAPPIAEMGIVVARTTDGNLQGFSTATGDRVWAYRFTVPSLSLRGTATPVIYAGGVLCGGDDGRLTVVKLDTGQVLWDLPVAVTTGASELARIIDIDIPVVIDRRTVFVGAYQGRVAAIEGSNSKVIWAREKSVYLPLAVDDYNVYVVDNRSFVWALNRFSGATVWEQEALRARPASGVAVYKDAVVLGDFEGELHVLDASDGRMIARKDLGSRINVQPYADGDRIYVINESGKLYALKIERFSENG